MNIRHKSTMIELGNDLDTKKYLRDVELLLSYKDNKSYVVYRCGKLVGIFVTALFNYETYLYYGILPDYRHKGIVTLLLKEYGDYVFKNDKTDKGLYLQINQSNLISYKIATKNDFHRVVGTKYRKGR